MALHTHERKKPMLYSDLFKCHRNDTKEEERISIISPSPSSSPKQTSSSFCDSSISGFSSPFGSETASSESSDADFMAELTRQMAECMLQDEDEDEQEKQQQTTNHEKQGSRDSAAAAAISNLKYPMYQNPVRVYDHMPPLEVYELKNQPPVRKQGTVCRVKGTDSAHKKQIHKTAHHNNNNNNNNNSKNNMNDIQMQYRRTTGRKRHGAGGSGMRAVFLGGSKPASASSGTGVFLPRAASDLVELKNKSGCSTVLIPTRVLQTLELHFNRYSDSVTPPPVISGGRYSSSRKDEGTRSSGQQSGAPQMDGWPAAQDDAAEEMQLPQEWTY